jgi:Ran GTPase-activating protein (RanGAP) involved in mRNA processing and transport
LNSLNLSSNQIGDEGVQYLSDALQNNAVRSSILFILLIMGVMFLILQTLTELYLSFNQIGEEGAKYLSNLLKNGIVSLVKPSTNFMHVFLI